MLTKLGWLAVAGACGAVARYALAGIAQRAAQADFPLGTLAVNVLGCFLFGVVWTFGDRLLISGETRFLILTGFMGAFTTFSTFAFETAGMLGDSQWWPAVGNLAAHNGLGVVSIFLGMATGRLL